LYVNKFAEIPFTVLSMLTSVVNYGGRINDDKDMRTADIIIADFLTPDILNESYKFSRSGIYKTIETDCQRGYLDYIDSLPQMPEPEVFGMHGADSASFIKLNLIWWRRWRLHDHQRADAPREHRSTQATR
jgi:dynein heavy chain